MRNNEIFFGKHDGVSFKGSCILTENIFILTENIFIFIENVFISIEKIFILIENIFQPTEIRIFWCNRNSNVTHSRNIRKPIEAFKS